MQRTPNVVLVITDDQGYGDLGCTGNPRIRTPNIDGFHGESVHLTDFHVSPLCTPTRGAIMSGKRPIRNGAWATTWGRSFLGRNEYTLAEAFRDSGYRTGMFGKWHLGDNYPYRPQDRGFETVTAHKGGGVGQTPDFWGNNYFDDTYFRNGAPEEFTGYCTDIWFDAALRFIEDHRDEPFFAYIATNAPHSPYLVAERYEAPYRNNPDIPEPAFYGMIENIDENFGRLRTTLTRLGLEEDTILIFMTDNGSSAGCELDREGFVTRGYNAGMRGKKGSYYEGGHRVPLFIRWPAGGIGSGGEGAGPEIAEMTLHVDLFPTFMELCMLDSSEARETSKHFDGRSLAPLLRGETDRLEEDRVHFLQYRQHTEPPEKWTNAVMTRRWRLVGGSELYDIVADSEQRNDVAADNPEVVERLRVAHENQWREIEPTFREYHPISLGNEAENPTRLDAFDVMGDAAWSQAQIARAVESCGRWRVDVERTGRYRFELRRWPEEFGLGLRERLPDEWKSRLASHGSVSSGPAVVPIRAELVLFDTTYESEVDAGMESVVFEADLQQTGVTDLEAWLLCDDGKRRGAYYVYVEREL